MRLTSIRFHLAVVHPGVGSRAAVRKESHSMPTLYLRSSFALPGLVTSTISVSMYSLKYLLTLKLLARAHNSHAHIQRTMLFVMAFYWSALC